MTDSDATDPLVIALREMSASAHGHDNDTLVPGGQRACPICGTHMTLITEQSVTMDICEEHGVWLDQGELASLLERTYRYRRESEAAHVKMDRHALREETAERLSSSMRTVCHLVG